jgi:triose/dihydroxyacetone kinase / FAD-AMP lyase (cyclizing)
LSLEELYERPSSRWQAEVWQFRESLAEHSWCFILPRFMLGAHSDVEQTSLNMPGFSLTLLLLPPPSPTAAPPSDVILRLLDAKTSAPGWKWSSGARPSVAPSPSAVLPERATEQRQRVRAQDEQEFVRAVERACNALDKAEPEITKMDTVSGDGDCGLTLQTGAHGA